LAARFSLAFGTVKTPIRTGMLLLRGRLEHSQINAAMTEHFDDAVEFDEFVALAPS
jgi:hypothetical protein